MTALEEDNLIKEIEEHFEKSCAKFVEIYLQFKDGDKTERAIAKAAFDYLNEFHPHKIPN